MAFEDKENTNLPIKGVARGRWHPELGLLRASSSGPSRGAAHSPARLHGPGPENKDRIAESRHVSVALVGALKTEVLNGLRRAALWRAGNVLRAVSDYRDDMAHVLVMAASKSIALRKYCVPAGDSTR